MEGTVLGTGSEVPVLGKAGSAVLLKVGDEPLLFDCGPDTVYQLLRADVNPKSVTDVFFTHHDVGHNSSFGHLWMAGWTLGRTSLSVYGPEKTAVLLDATERVWDEDAEFRLSLGRSEAGLTDVDWQDTGEQPTVETERWSVTAHPATHPYTEAVKYEVSDSHTGATVVVSLTPFAPTKTDSPETADMLLQGCPLGPVATELPTNSDTWYDYVRDFDSQDGEAETGLCTPEDAAQYATELGVERLVLTHHLPYRDPAEMATRAESEFSGTVTVADDLQTLTV